MFVSLLRAKPRTKPVDVELFFADQKKLVSKCARVTTTQCEIEMVKEYLEKLRKIRDRFSVSAQHDDPNGPDLSPFNCIADWSINYCQAAQIDLAVVNHEKEIAALRLKAERAEQA